MEGNDSIEQMEKTIREKLEKTICRSTSADAYSRLKNCLGAV